MRASNPQHHTCARGRGEPCRIAPAADHQMHQGIGLLMDIKASIIRRGYRMRDRIISQIDVLRALWALPGRRRYGLGRPD